MAPAYFWSAIQGTTISFVYLKISFRGNVEDLGSLPQSQSAPVLVAKYEELGAAVWCVLVEL